MFEYRFVRHLSGIEFLKLKKKVFAQIAKCICSGQTLKGLEDKIVEACHRVGRHLPGILRICGFVLDSSDGASKYSKNPE